MAKSKKTAKKPATKSAKTKIAKKAPLGLKAKSTMAKLMPTKSGKSANSSAPVKFVATKSSKGMGLKRFSPLDDRIVIERVVAPEKTAGGLYIPDSAQEKPTEGKVVAVGRGHLDAKGRIRPCDVKVGDTVLFTAWTGAEIELDGVKYVIMREPDLLGVTNV